MTAARRTAAPVRFTAPASVTWVAQDWGPRPEIRDSVGDDSVPAVIRFARIFMRSDAVGISRIVAGT